MLYEKEVNWSVEPGNAGDGRLQAELDPGSVVYQSPVFLLFSLVLRWDLPAQ